MSLSDAIGFSDVWAQWMISMSWQVAVLVAILLFMEWGLRKQPSRLRYLLWSLVPLRLVLPPTLALATGWAWWVLPASESPLSARSMEMRATEETDIAAGFHSEIFVAPKQHALEQQPVNELGNRSLSVVLPPSRPWSWKLIGCTAWCAGFLGMLVRLGAGYWRARTIWRSASRVTDESLKRLLAASQARMNVRHVIELCESTQVDSPLLIGWRRPRIILPPGLLQSLSGGEMEAVLVHELQHLVRYDVWFCLIQSLLKACYFFHPAVWLADRRLRYLREEACDEATVQVLDGQRRDYGSAILKLAEQASSGHSAMALGVVESGPHLVKRLRRILDPQLPWKWKMGVPGMLLILGIAAVLLPSAARTEEPAAAAGTLAPPVSPPAVQTGERAIEGKASAPAEQAATPSKPKVDGGPEITLTGKVLNADGTPRSGAKAFVLLRHLPPLEAVTDISGQFRVQSRARSLNGCLIRAYAEDTHEQAVTQLPYKTEEIPKFDLQLHLKPEQTIQLEVRGADGQTIADAKCGITIHSHLAAIAITNAEGKAEFRVPQSTVDNVFAVKSGAGFDYVNFEVPLDQYADKNAAPPQIPEQPISLTLKGARTVQVVVTKDGKPLPDIKVYPWIFEKPGQPNDINISMIQHEFWETTSETGSAVFSWIPAWGRITFTAAVPGRQGMTRAIWDPKSPSDQQIRIETSSGVPIRGRVTAVDGSPVVGATIYISGSDRDRQDFSTKVVSGADGNYEALVPPDMLYIAVAQYGKLASAVKSGIIVRPGQPQEKVDLTVQSATRLFGRITEGTDKKPLANQRVAPLLVNSPKQEFVLTLPDPKRTPFQGKVQLKIQFPTKTNPNGEYEIYLGPGEYYVMGPGKPRSELVIINSKETERELNFHSDYSPEGILKGIVETEDHQPVPKAKISSQYAAGNRVEFQAITTASGEYAVERVRFEIGMLATSEDGKLAGVAIVPPEADTANITLRPVGQIQGKLLDGPGELLVMAVLNMKTRYARNQAFSRRITTDADGGFVIPGCVTDQTYQIMKVNHRGAGELDSYSPIETVVMGGRTTVDLGEVQVKTSN